MKFSLKEMILIGTFAALTAVCAQISIPLPFSPVPITMQVLAVCLSAAILGKKCGTFSQIIYVLLGAFGAPVFSRFHGGLSVITGPTGGYIISFPIAAFIIGMLIENKKRASILNMLLAMFAGLLVCYFIGTVWLGLSLKLTFVKAIIMGAGWYLPLDIIKIMIAAYIGHQVRSALIRANYVQL